jgi:hypothetical protein
MGPPSYMKSVVDGNVVMRRMTVTDQAVRFVNKSCADISEN